jgi:hypothetical protein
MRRLLAPLVVIDVSNGLALHHTLFDRGAFTVSASG